MCVLFLRRMTPLVSLRTYTDTQRQAQFTVGMDDDCLVPFVKLW
jgi:hypothetical protein